MGQEITQQSTGMYTANLHKKCIDMLNKNSPGVKKSEAKSEALASSYSYTQLKSVISCRGQDPSCLLATIYYIKMKSHLSVCPSVGTFRHAHNFAVSQRIDSGLARNVSHVFWHQQVCFDKFLTAAVFLSRHFERWRVEDFCSAYVPVKPKPRQV